MTRLTGVQPVGDLHWKALMYSILTNRAKVIKKLYSFKALILDFDHENGLSREFT